MKKVFVQSRLIVAGARCVESACCGGQDTAIKKMDRGGLLEPRVWDLQIST